MKLTFNFEGTTFYLVLFFGVLSSIFRFYLAETPFFAVVYLPQLLMLTVVLVHFSIFLAGLKIKKVFLFVLLMLLLALIVGLIYTNTIFQVMMGCYMFIPLLYGFTMYPFLDRIIGFSPFYTVLLIIAIVGVTINVWYPYPWEGFSYEINGVTIEGNRYWTSHGKKRYAGLGRTSFETAGYLLFLGIMFLSQKLRVTLLWLATGVAIFITDAKGLVLSFLIISVLVTFKTILPEFLKKLALIGLLVINIVLPLISWVFTIDDFTDLKFLRSFEMRLEDSWPAAYELISESGNIITGRGIGGIGVPQNLFETDKYQPADNLFVYLLAIFGITTVVLYAMVIRKIYNKKFTHTAEEYVLYLLSIYVFSYGVTTNVVELPVMAICLGLVFRYWLQPQQQAYELA